MPEEGDRAGGCLKAIGFLLGLAVLGGIGSCAWINSAQIAIGFPDGLHYDRVIAYSQEPGLMEGCVFVAYHLTDNRVAPSAIRLVRSDPRNGYSAYRPTPLVLVDHKALVDGHERYLFALGAAGGCNVAFDELPDAETLLGEPGNFFAISQNDEGLSIVSPRRRLVLFLYFG